MIDLLVDKAALLFSSLRPLFSSLDKTRVVYKISKLQTGLKCKTIVVTSSPFSAFVYSITCWVSVSVEVYRSDSPVRQIQQRASRTLVSYQRRARYLKSEESDCAVGAAGHEELLLLISSHLISLAKLNEKLLLLIASQSHLISLKW